MKFYDIKIKQFDSKHIQVIRYSRPNITDFVSPNKGKKKNLINEKNLSANDIVYRRNKSNKDSINRTINTVYDVARSNVWEYFVTLTFNPKMIDSFDFSVVTKKLSSWIDTIRRNNPNICYLGVPERHKSGRYHFHFLFSNVNFNLIDSGKFTDKGLPIFNVGNYKWGFSTAIKIYDTVGISKYICKYITKDLCFNTKGKKRYWRSRNLNLPKVFEFDSTCENIDLDLFEFEVVHSQTKNTSYISYTGQQIEATTDYIEMVKID